VIPFDSKVFGTAANNGQMIAELSRNHRASLIFQQIARQLTGRAEPKKSRSLLAPVLERLRGKPRRSAAGM
jgi:pilus assembly protein CpaE